MCPKGVQNPRY